jgi:hypothetical protein
MLAERESFFGDGTAGLRFRRGAVRDRTFGATAVPPVLGVVRAFARGFAFCELRAFGVFAPLDFTVVFFAATLTGSSMPEPLQIMPLF